MDKEYSSKGLKIILFPCNQFGNEEPKSENEIKQWQEKRYGGKYMMMSKIEVNGDNTHPVYYWLRRNSDMCYDKKTIKIPWNFSKFLLNRNGEIVKHIDEEPSPVALIENIEKLLNE